MDEKKSAEKQDSLLQKYNGKNCNVWINNGSTKRGIVNYDPDSEYVELVYSEIGGKCIIKRDNIIFIQERG